MKQLTQNKNKLVSNIEKSHQSVSVSQRNCVRGSIRERVAAIREDAKQGLACDAGFGN